MARRRKRIDPAKRPCETELATRIKRMVAHLKSWRDCDILRAALDGRRKAIIRDERETRNLVAFAEHKARAPGELLKLAEDISVSARGMVHAARYRIRTIHEGRKHIGVWLERVGSEGERPIWIRATEAADVVSAETAEITDKDRVRDVGAREMRKVLGAVNQSMAKHLGG